jgi:hypothetical protein
MSAQGVIEAQGSTRSRPAVRRPGSRAGTAGSTATVDALRGTPLTVNGGVPVRRR